MSIERVVAVLTPAFAALAGLVTTVIGRAVPGVSLSKADVTALFIAGVTAGLSAALKWLHGRQKFVQFTGDAEKLVDQVVAKVLADKQAGPAVENIEHLLEAHTAQIVDAVAKAVHAPASAEEIAQAMVGRLVQAQGTAPTVTGPGAPTVP